MSLGLFLILMVPLLVIAFSVEFRLVMKGLEIAPRIRFGIGRFRVAIPQGLLGKITQRIRRRNFGSAEAALRGSKTAWRLADNLLQKIDLLHLEVLIGFGDPFWTAMGAGSLWAIMGPFLTGLSAANRLRSSLDIRVLPDYGDPSVQVYLHCIFRFRLGQIIINELRRVVT